MAEELLYDPKTKQAIKDLLFAFLYDPAKDALKKRLKVIIINNSHLHGNAQNWLSYRGEKYSYGPEHRTRPMNRLKESLKPVMDDYVSDLDYINEKELPYVIGFINQTLNASSSLQDYLTVFPASIHKPLKGLIDNCGCRVQKLAPETLDDIKIRNEIPIAMMKKRMVLNLLL